MLLFGTHHHSSAANRVGSARPRSRRLTALLTLTVAITASGIAAAAPATALIVGPPAAESGVVSAWGSNGVGQTNVPAGLSNITAISAGSYFNTALKSDGTVVAWGSNDAGQTVVPAGLSGVTAISSGGYFSLALENNGAVVAWGDNDFGQATVPAGLSGVTAVSAGVYHSLALKNDGTVVAWGSNGNGQSAVPAGLTDVVAISAGGYYSLALKNDGTVVAWGINNYGQRNVPAGLTGVRAIAAGGIHALALKSDGTVVAWGNNSYGEATPPVGLSGVKAVATGYYHSFALKTDGTLVSWGLNNAGQTTVPTSTNDVLAIAGGVSHSLVLKLSPAPVFTGDLPPTTVQAGVPVNYVFTASGTPAPTFAVSAGDLPAGLSLSEDGVLSGTSTVTGSSEFTVTANNGNLPDAVSSSHTIEVTPGPVDAISVAPQTLGSTTYTGTAGAALPFTINGVDQWGNPLTDQAAVITTDHTGGANPDAVSGGSVTFYTAGVHLVTTTIGGVSTTVSVTTMPGAPVATEISSDVLQVALGGSINLTMSGLDVYGNVIDLTSQAVFTSDWAVDVISGSTVTFPHASPHVITGRVGSLTSATTIEVVEPTMAASTGSALAFTGSSPLPAVFGGVGALLLGLLLSFVAWSRRRNRASTR